MTYHGPQMEQGFARLIGLKPTQEDRDYVKTLSVMGVGVREICDLLGKRFNLGKSMSRMTLYYHFRRELINKKRGRKMGKKKLSVKMKNNIISEMQRMMDEIKARHNKS